MIKLDMNEANEILDLLSSNWDPIKHNGKRTDISALMYEETDTEAHKIKISYHGGKTLHEKDGTVTNMIIDRLINIRLTVRDAVDIIGTVLDYTERVIFEDKETSLYILPSTTKAKWADKVNIKFHGYKSTGKRRRRGTLRDMVYDTLQITYNDNLSYILKERTNRRKNK